MIGCDVIAVGAMDEESTTPRDLVRKIAVNPTGAQSLVEVGIDNAAAVQRLFAAQGRELKEWLVDAQINRDRNLRLHSWPA